MQFSARTLPLARALRHARRLRKLRGWDRLLRRLFPPDGQARFEFSIPFFGYRYIGVSDSFIDWSAFFYGAYEDELLAEIGRLLRSIEKPLIVDVGANSGHHSLFFASLNDASVHAFEPNPELWSGFEQLIDANRLAQKIHLHKFGLGKSDDELIFYPPSGSNRGTGTFRKARNIGAKETDRLPVHHGDRCLSDLGISQIDLIKVDVEGFEKDVIEGLENTLKTTRPILWIEISGSPDERCKSLTALRKALSGCYSFRIAKRRGILFNRTDFMAMTDLPNESAFNLFCIPQSSSI